MALVTRNLSVLAYANGFTLWHYKAQAEETAIVASSGYFNGAGDMLATGDMVMISASDGGRILCVLSDGDVVVTAPLG